MSYLGITKPVVLSSTNGNIIPDADNTYQIGTSSKRFRTGYLQDVSTASIVSVDGAITTNNTTTSRGISAL